MVSTCLLLNPAFFFFRIHLFQHVSCLKVSGLSGMLYSSEIVYYNRSKKKKEKKGRFRDFYLFIYYHWVQYGIAQVESECSFKSCELITAVVILVFRILAQCGWQEYLFYKGQATFKFGWKSFNSIYHRTNIIQIIIQPTIKHTNCFCKDKDWIPWRLLYFKGK